jgi:murein DD-endopeptidase MepM/ murein hydrolase activator NlpD
MTNKLLPVILTLFWIFATAFLPIPPVADYPKGYFMMPVSHTVVLSGNFGELRPNHFHAGLDIKPAKRGVTEPIFAAADGFVSRIGIKAGGYGNAVYIQHPNGYTTNYAHLDKLITPLADSVRAEQYANESFEVDYRPTPSRFPVKKGQQIGMMGNTGGSQGMHLHFEIRDTKTEKIINPLLFGLNVPDNLPPKMVSMRSYCLNNQNELLDSRSFSLIKKGNVFGITGDTLVFNTDKAGFGIKTYDAHNAASGDNGVFSIETRANDSLIYRFRSETFAFNETKYINAHMDYEEQAFHSSYFNRTFLLQNNQLSMYDKVVNSGMIDLQTQPTKVSIVSKDINGNSSTLVFWVKKGVPIVQKVDKQFNYILKSKEENVVKTDGFHLYFPKDALYEDLYLKYDSNQDGSYGMYSRVHRVHDAKTPLHKMFEIGILPKNLPDSLRSKAIIAHCSPSGEVSNCGGKWTPDGKLIANSGKFGSFFITIDNTPPTIQPIDFKEDMRQSSRMSFKISDNIGTIGNANSLQYRAEVDGKWILLEFDGKTATLTHRFDGRIAAGNHTLKFTLTDDRGNATVFEKTFLK